jgi:biopolymer transport protein ExbD
MAKKRKVPGINASSMADISFIIFIFFLLTTSMDTHRGLQRRLPPPLPPDQEIEDIEINRRNLFVVRINSMNQLMVQGQIMDVRNLREKTKEFILNEFNDPNLPEIFEEYFEHFGIVAVTREHVISLQTDVDTQYQAYMEVQNELIAAYNELRNEFARARLGRPFNELSVDLQRAIIRVFPQKISEAEPRNFGGS